MNKKPENTQYLYEGVPVTRQSAGHFYGLIREDRPKVPSNQVALMRWDGAKIPRYLWHAAKSFLLYSDMKYNSEATIWFFYSDERNVWRAAVPPQYIGEGLSSHVITNDSGFDDAFSWVSPEQGWRENGTGHHHCSTSAFMSGTDEADEKKKTGIHYTLGNMRTKDKFSFHARASFRGLIYGIEGAQWFEGFDEDDFLKPGSHLDFPNKWLDHVKTRPAATKHTMHRAVYGRYYKDVNDYGFSTCYGHHSAHQYDGLAAIPQPGPYASIKGRTSPVVTTSAPVARSVEEVRKSKSRSNINSIVRLLEKNDFLHDSLSDDIARYRLIDTLESFVDSAQSLVAFHTGRPTFQSSDVTNMVRGMLEMSRPDLALRNMARDLDSVYREPEKAAPTDTEEDVFSSEWDPEWDDDWGYDQFVHMGYGVYLTEDEEYVDFNGDEIPDDDPRLTNLVMCPSEVTDISDDTEEEYDLVYNGVWRKRDTGHLVDILKRPLSEAARDAYLADLQEEATRGSAWSYHA